MSESAVMTEPAKLLLLASILAKGGVISQNGKAFFKVHPLLSFTSSSGRNTFDAPMCDSGAHLEARPTVDQNAGRI
jgi:hypothetical protein